MLKRAWKRSFSLTYGEIRIAAVTYALLPVALFLMFFLRWYFALIGLTAIGVGYYSLLKQRKTNSLRPAAIELRVSSMVGIFAIMLLWCQLGGMNGYMFQTTDWDCRNAVFRDLITHRWPVVYNDSNSALVYYVGHWLPPAMVAKVFNKLFHSIELAWFVGRVALWFWTALGLSVLVLLLFAYIKAESTKKRIIAIVVLIFFSGLDIVGALYYGKCERLLSPDLLHLERWAKHGYQYSSITTCLYWVFNQSVIPWMMTLCFLMDSDERNYVTYSAACLICGPLPLIGLAILMVFRAVCRLIRCIREQRVKDWCKAIFSVGNILVVILCVPMMAVYLLSNSALAATGESQRVVEQASFFSTGYWNRSLLAFYAVEVGVYLVLLWNAHKKEPLFYAVAVSLLCIPYFHIGTSMDFCMRASLPGIFIILTYVADYLAQYFSTPRQERKHVPAVQRLCAMALVGAFLCGAITPAVEIYRGLYNVVSKGDFEQPYDPIGSFDNGKININFQTTDADQRFFYKYLAR